MYTFLYYKPFGLKEKKRSKKRRLSVLFIKINKWKELYDYSTLRIMGSVTPLTCEQGIKAWERTVAAKAWKIAISLEKLGFFIAFFAPGVFGLIKMHQSVRMRK